MGCSGGHGLVSSAARSALVDGLAVDDRGILGERHRRAAVGYDTRSRGAAAFPLVLSGIRTTPERPPTTPSRPASVAWRWLGADVEAGADDAGDERSRVSASRYASVHMAAIARRLSAV